MDAYYVLLRCPRQYDVNVIHREQDNVYNLGTKENYRGIQQDWREL